MRFEFGKNWGQFLALLDEERIRTAGRSLQEMVPDLDFKEASFLDLGSGSGLFSLAARRLGARVSSLDIDPLSVSCTRELKNRFFPEDPGWTVLQGSVLDQDLLRSLGRFSLVYSWGVLHHTGALWQALDNSLIPLAPGGRLCLSIYNDQGRASRFWTRVKRFYNEKPEPVKKAVLGAAFIRIWGPTLIRDGLRGRGLDSWRNYGRFRGMSPWHDLVDWVGGFPFETAAPDRIFNFFHRRGLTLSFLRTCGGGRGCNEYVFSLDPHNRGKT